jgi:putative oxidoreductase
MAIEKRVELSDGTPAVPVPMPVRPYPSAAVSLGLLALRVPMGVYFILAGWYKVRTLGVAKFVESQSEVAARYMPEKFAHMYLNALPYAEIALGVMLVVGLLTRFVGLVMTLLLVSFTIAVTKVYHETLPFQPNVIYIGVALAILLCGPGRFSVDGILFGRRRRVTITEQYTERLP